MASKRARLPGRRFAWTQYAASYVPSPAHGSGSIAQRPRRAQARRLRSSKSPWTRTAGDGCVSSRSTAFLAQASRRARRPPFELGAIQPLPGHRREGRQVGKRRELELPEEGRDVAGVGIDCGVAGNDSFEQKGAERLVCVQQLGGRATRPCAQAGDLPGGTVPRARQLQHRLAAVGPPDEPDGREKPARELRAEHELPPLGDLGLEAGQAPKPRPAFVPGEARERRAERWLDGLAHDQPRTNDASGRRTRPVTGRPIPHVVRLSLSIPRSVRLACAGSK